MEYQTDDIQIRCGEGNLKYVFRYAFYGWVETTTFSIIGLDNAIKKLHIAAGDIISLRLNDTNWIEIKENEMNKGILNDGLSSGVDYTAKSLAGIQDHPEQKFFEFYPAGYAHQTAGGIWRQDYHKSIFERAQKDNSNIEIGGVLFPIDIDSHYVFLAKDPGNKHDPYAINVYLIVGDKKFDLGYIPMKISKLIHHHWDRLSEGRIYKVNEKVYNKYYSTKIVFSYDGQRFLGDDTLTYERLSDIVDEINED